MKLTSVLIIAYNSKVHFVQNDPFSQIRSHIDYDVMLYIIVCGLVVPILKMDMLYQERIIRKSV